MITKTYELELITSCFCAGAEPKEQAEIRAPSIRGQLRWWFRALGGFKSLAARGMGCREQERLIFGSTAGESGNGGRLAIRTRGSPPSRRTSGAELGADNIASTPGYLLFPLRSQKDKKTGQRIQQYRGVISVKGRFNIDVVWHGELSPFTRSDEAKESLTALIATLGHLGGLGFRSRRGYGALSLVDPVVTLRDSRDMFAKPENLVIRTLGSFPASQVQNELWKWLVLMRTHGSTHHGTKNTKSPNWDLIRHDHDQGLIAGSHSEPDEKVVHRAALGLPIIQQFSQPSRAEVDWYPEYDQRKVPMKKGYKGEGRFASPVLLRPHRDAKGNCHALVIFVDAHKWPDGKPVYLNGQARQVAMVTLPDGTRSPALYEAMKNDKALKPFTG
jgi:CRISPR type III-B/RAMP module RAMP protein Cmr1